jgi:hypothetical protein
MEREYKVILTVFDNMLMSSSLIPLTVCQFNKTQIINHKAELSFVTTQLKRRFKLKKIKQKQL